jgi:hypothetical protein
VAVLARRASESRSGASAEADHGVGSSRRVAGSLVALGGEA